jgi:molybdopterin-guanine dinucleotide biosynthesis adapter protein
MKVFGIVGYSGMGKTSLLEQLVPILTERGLCVSLIKHSHKAVDIDRPGKDSYRMRAAGGHEVVLLGNERWALVHELRGAPEPSLKELLTRLQPCDLVLVEGFKQDNFPKLEVWRPSRDQPTLWPKWPQIFGIASDTQGGIPESLEGHIPPQQLDLHDVESIADFVLQHAQPAESLACFVDQIHTRDGAARSHHERTHT